jgi:hypothetical protein
METNASERRCSAETKRGRCQVTRGLNAEGLCPMHAGTTDPRELGKRSGEARRKPNPERVQPALRQYLRDNVAPSEVWGALKLTLEGQNESARVGASKVLMDALAEPARGCPGCEARKAEAPDIEAKLIDLLTRHAAGNETERKQQIRTAVHEELAAVAEHVDVTQVEEQLVTRL